MTKKEKETYVPKIYGYIRVSTEKQTVENQRFEINNFCKREHIKIDQWFEETISGTKPIEKRDLGKLLNKLHSDDTIICAEISRLGRKLLMIMDVLSACMKRGVRLWTIKESYRLGNDIQSQVLAFAFGLSAEIERNLISQRTKEALHRIKAEGKTLGRPKGRKNRVELHPLYRKDETIASMLKKGFSQLKISKKLRVNRNTVYEFLKIHPEIKKYTATKYTRVFQKKI